MKKMWREGDEAPYNEIQTETKAEELQKLSVIETLPSLLAAGDPQTCIQRLMPKMQQTLPTASTEFHVAASSTFKTILEQKLVSHSTFTQTFLQSILNSLDSRDQIVAEAWLETLLDVIDLLPSEVIKNEILPTAVNKGQLSQPVNSRMMCCKLIGKICTRFDSQLTKKQVLPTVHSLCQDVNSEVRACICLQLRFVAEGLGPESLKSTLLPSIVELASDEASLVRHASIQTIVYLLPHLQHDIIKSTISPLIKKSCENALKSDDTVICIIAQEYGKLVVGLEKCLSATEKNWFIKYFQQLSQIGIISMKKDNNTKDKFPITNSNPLINERYVECRQLCAFNIPAMFLFASLTVDEVDGLLGTFGSLVNDPFCMVRRTVACGIHEVAKILGPNNHLIKGELIKLLKDDSEEVLQGLIPHVAQTLELLTQSQTIGIDKIDTTAMELGRALLKCENEIFRTNNWRLSVMMFEQFEILPKCFPSDYIYMNFVPVSLDRAMNARPIPIRLAAGRTFLVFIRYNLKLTQRNELRSRLYNDFARNSSCYVRMLFLRMMIEAMTIFSSMYFKEYFFSTVMSLTEDPIANIRLKVVTLLPTLKSYLRLPTDKKLLANFDASVRNLMNNEKDRDVIFALTNIICKLDEIDVPHEGQPTSSKLNKHNSDDLKKYEEKKKLQSSIPGKTLPPGQLTVPTLKKSVLTSGKSTTSEGNNVRSRKTSVTSDSISKSILSTSSSSSSMSRGKQAGLAVSITDSAFKGSKQPTTPSRNFDLSKASTSSDNLTSSWARLTSNSMLLTHLWKKIDQPDTNMSINSTNTIDITSDNYIPNLRCPCYNNPTFINSSPCNFKYNNSLNNSHSCSCFTSDACSKSMDFHSCPHTNTSLTSLTSQQTRDYKNDDYLKNYFLTKDHNNYNHDDDDDDDTRKPNITALRALTNVAHYNSCWTFSSMPEIPVTLLDDEFLVDTGVRIPAQLSSSQSTSKIPNLQDIIYRNTRIGNFNKSRRCSVNLDKGKSKGHYLIFDQVKMNYDDRRYDGGSCHQLDDDLKERKYVSSSSSSSSRVGKSRLSFVDSSGKIDDKNKRSTTILERDKMRISHQHQQSRTIIDRTKRHSTCYGTKLTSEMNKDSKNKFKRHSLEVTDYRSAEHGSNRLKRNFTLDVNHNQGLSKIPLRNPTAASGSRTAPVTRASSPIRIGTELSFHRAQSEISHDYCTERQHMTRFSSSDEDVDKLCIRLAYVDSSSYIRDDNPRKSLSKLPVWVPRKKS